MLVSGSINNYDYGLDGLGLSLKPPKWVRNAAAAVGKVLAKAAPIASVASFAIPVVGPGVAAAIRGAGIVAGAAKTATSIIGAARPLLPRAPSTSVPSTPPPSASPLTTPSARVFRPINSRPIFKAAPVGTPPGTPGTVMLPGTDTPILVTSLEPVGRRAVVPTIPGNTAPISLVPNTDSPATSARPPGRTMVPVDQDMNPISLPSPDLTQAIADAAARVANNAASATAPTSPLQPTSALSPYGGGYVVAPGTATADGGSFPWVPVLAVGGLLLFSQGGRRRAA